jgi:hypothetical protein
MTRPPTPYPAEPTHGSRILESDRHRRIARRAHLRELETVSFILLIGALLGAVVVLVSNLIAGSIA